ncbi:uncharacterized protein LOC108739140 [Agrilus planipennis]|uniref:Uncharacterized protein LOC108739140 n=1 Tax=Agrilus planipennis TaxID=224129 RepID=A0A1W4WWX7_AGRPL|nr:uncharacterized protein LOC108739140 [Agrilus planipennis]
MKAEGGKSEAKLRPEAPVFVPKLVTATVEKNPVETILQHFANKEPQCSRYSKKSVRRYIGSYPNGPRPILGTNKLPFPRPILGRKENDDVKEEEEFIGREFRSLSRKMQKVKVEEEEEEKHDVENEPSDAEE